MNKAKRKLLRKQAAKQAKMDITNLSAMMPDLQAYMQNPEVRRIGQELADRHNAGLPITADMMKQFQPYLPSSVKPGL